ncbi:MAG: porin [Planctomycetales bacterium]|nr:porin [Planctomycetales bacterium]
MSVRWFKIAALCATTSTASQFLTQPPRALAATPAVASVQFEEPIVQLADAPTPAEDEGPFAQPAPAAPNASESETQQAELDDTIASATTAQASPTAGSSHAGNAAVSSYRLCCPPIACEPLVDFGGWMAWGFYDNSHGLDGQNGNTPLGFNNVAEELMLHQAWLHASKEADNGGEGWDWGFRMDFMFGADGPDTVAFGDGGWDASWQTSSQYGFAMPQLYGEFAFGKTTVKVGHFYTIIGYEVVQAPDNFFYSHAYTMYYNEPFTHTGVLSTTTITDAITLYSGLTAGWDSGFSNKNDGKTWLGGVGLQLTERMNLIWAATFGDPGDDPATATDVYMQSLVLDMTLSDQLNYVFQTDFQTRRPDPAVGPAFKQYGINQYLIRQLNDQWAAGMRYEWFYAGENVGAPLGLPANLAASPGLHYHGLTCGLNYRPSDRVLIKPEIRYDWVDYDGPVPGGPFDRGTARSQFTWGLQSIWMF